MVAQHLVGWTGDAPQAIVESARVLGLTVATDGALRKYPGSRHWHFKNGKRAGTLEVTYWPSTKAIWVAYHANRIGDGWVVEALERLAHEIASRLSGSVTIGSM